MKNVIRLGNFFLPWDQEREVQMMRNIVKEQTLLQRRRKNLGLSPLKKNVIKPAVLRESVS